MDADAQLVLRHKVGFALEQGITHTDHAHMMGIVGKGWTKKTLEGNNERYSMLW